MVTLLRAPNPSPMTLDGTNGYVVSAGRDLLVAIDPGIDDEAHLETFVRTARDERSRYAAILVTHGHPDHFPGALALRRATGAPIYAHSSAAYDHDVSLDDGARLTFGDATLDVLHTPGHAPDHLVFWHAGEAALFTGDVVVGTGTVVIAPPSGDMRRYQASLERLLREYGVARTIYGGHGPAIHAPRAKLEEYIEHRKSREAQIVAVLARKPATIPALVAEIYAGVSETVWPAAARQVLAYLIALEREGIVQYSVVGRPPTAQETRLLNPDLGELARSADARLARAELGVGTSVEPLALYALTEDRSSRAT